MSGHTGGILLAGGRGERLGLGSPKALVEVGGRTLFERALETLGAVCDELVLLAPAAIDLPASPARRVEDEGKGPLAALVDGLRAAPWTRAVVLGVDLPFVTPEALLALCELRGDAPAVVPAPQGRPQPLAAWYWPAAFAAITRASAAGGRALVPAVLAASPRMVEDAELAALPGGSEAYFNLNTPDDLAFARRRLLEAAS